MLKFVQDEEIIFQTTFYSDLLKDNPVDPGSIELELEDAAGNSYSPDVDEDGSRPENEGKYIATHTVDSYGVWAWRWITENPRIVRQGTFLVVQNNQED